MIHLKVISLALMSNHRLKPAPVPCATSRWPYHYLKNNLRSLLTYFDNYHLLEEYLFKFNSKGSIWSLQASTGVK